MRVSINILGRNGSAEKTCKAMATGIKRCGDEPVFRTDSDHNMQGFDACVLWGYVLTCQTIIKSCISSGKPYIFLDMGYWRRERGYYKVAVNDRHPTNYLMSQEVGPARFNQLEIGFRPFRKSGKDILLAGMSHKAAWSWKLQTEGFETEAASILRRHTQRRIVYRPKPSWPDAQPIFHTVFDRKTPLDAALAQAHCVVAHHSNVGCDALLHGVPVMVKHGAASVLCTYDLSKIETPYYPSDEERQAWANRLAYCQWSVAEMQSGACWEYLKTSGLLRK